MNKKIIKYGIIVFSLLLNFESSAQQFENGEIGISLNNWGRIRVHSPAIDNKVQIDRISYLAGISESKVFDYKNDGGVLESAILIANPLLSDYELYAKADNSFSSLPPDFNCAVNVYGFNDGGFALAKFTFTNKDSDSLKTYLGIELLPKIDDVYGFETAEYIADKNLALFRIGQNSTKVGLKILNEQLASFSAEKYSDNYFAGDSLLWRMLTGDSLTSSFEAGSAGSINVMGISAKVLNKEQSFALWIGICVGEDYSALYKNLDLAEIKYSTITSINTENEKLFPDLKLNQNYPNPFNSETTISFYLNESENIKIELFNMLGESIALLQNKKLNSGYNSIKLNMEKLNSNFSSGVYFIRISSVNKSVFQKIIYLK